MVGMAGFEPATSRSRTERTSQTVLHPVRGKTRGKMCIIAKTVKKTSRKYLSRKGIKS